MSNPYDRFFTAEDRLPIACVTWLSLQYPNLLFMHPANEAKRSPYERYKALKMKMVPGVPDLLIFHRSDPYVGLSVEFKAGKNKPTEKQQEFMSKLTETGWYCHVCYELDNFIALIKDYLA